MDGEVSLRVNWAHLIHWLAEDVEYPAQSFLADRHCDGAAQRDGFHAANHTVGGLHCDRTDAAFADVLRGFADDVDWLGDVKALADDADSGVNFGDLAFGELAVDGGTRDLDDHSDYFVSSCSCHIDSLAALFGGRRA